MSSIKLKHSGGNAVSLHPPTSAPATNDVQFKLPTADGSAGQVLKTDGSGNLSWVTVADTNDYVKLQNAVSSSAVSELNFDNLDVSTYKHFDLIGSFCPVNDGVSLRFRYRTGGASGSNVTTSLYVYGWDVMYPDDNEQNESAEGASKIIMTTGIGNNTGEGIYLNMRISLADSSDETHTRYTMNTITYSGIYINNQNAPRQVNGVGNLKHGTTYPTGFGLHFENGDVASSSYCLYGMKR